MGKQHCPLRKYTKNRDLAAHLGYRPTEIRGVVLKPEAAHGSVQKISPRVLILAVLILSILLSNIVMLCSYQDGILPCCSSRLTVIM